MKLWEDERWWKQPRGPFTRVSGTAASPLSSARLSPCALSFSTLSVYAEREKCHRPLATTLDSLFLPLCLLRSCFLPAPYFNNTTYELKKINKIKSLKKHPTGVILLVWHIYLNNLPYLLDVLDFYAFRFRCFESCAVFSWLKLPAKSFPMLFPFYCLSSVRAYECACACNWRRCGAKPESHVFSDGSPTDVCPLTATSAGPAEDALREAQLHNRVYLLCCSRMTFIWQYINK